MLAFCCCIASFRTQRAWLLRCELPCVPLHKLDQYRKKGCSSSARLFCTSPSRLLRFLQDQLCQAFLYISKQASPVSSRPALPGFSVHLQVGFSGFFKACSSLRLLRAFQRWTLSSPALRRKDFKDEITPNQVGLLVRIWNVSYHLGIVFEEEKHVKLITPFKW